LPARLRRTPNGVRARFALQERSFAEICTTFDEFDRQLRAGAFRFAVRWAESELDVAFDAQSIAKYRAATASDDKFCRSDRA
jgi:hypothetical protein